MRRALWLVPVCLAVLAWGLCGRPAGAADQKDDDKAKDVELGGLHSRPPAAWKEEQPSNNMRVAQFKLPHAEGDPRDAEVVINYFGPGGGGGLEANLQRWKGMMTPPKGKSADDAFKVEKMKVGDVAATYVDAEGTYKGAPFEKIEPRPDYRMIRVYFDCKDGPYFIALVGPAKTVARHKKGFDEWLKNFK